MYTYKTKGTCSTLIKFNVNPDDTVSDVEFVGGCKGNLQAVSRLVEGKTVDEVIFLLKGIESRGKTSCGDQLANALIKYQSEHDKDKN